MNQGIYGFPTSPPGVALLGADNEFRAFQRVNLNPSALSPGSFGTAFQSGNADGVINRFLFDSFSAQSNFEGRRANGSNATKAALTTNDPIVQMIALGHDGVSYTPGATASARISAAEPWDSTHKGSYHAWFGTPTGAAGGQTEWMRVADGALQLGGANTVISSARHHQHRSYTVATLPSAANAGEEIYVSNESGGAVLAFADGANWRRVTDRAIVT